MKPLHGTTINRGYRPKKTGVSLPTERSSLQFSGPPPEIGVPPALRDSLTTPPAQFGKSGLGSEGAAVFARILSSEEIDLLVRCLFNNETQREISMADGIPQQTVSYRIGRAVQKLRTAGIPVELPGRGRKKETPPLVYVEPDAMGRLVTSEDAAGRPRGRWIDSSKIDRMKDERDDEAE